MQNIDVLSLVAKVLGVTSSALETALSYKTKLRSLDPDGTTDNRDDLTKTLCSLLFAWLNRHINQHLCRDNFVTFIGLLDLPAPQNMASHLYLLVS